jgi:hypothetical protein
MILLWSSRSDAVVINTSLHQPPSREAAPPLLVETQYEERRFLTSFPEPVVCRAQVSICSRPLGGLGHEMAKWRLSPA